LELGQGKLEFALFALDHYRRRTATQYLDIMVGFAGSGGQIFTAGGNNRANGA
jgi:hypothetical protein